MIHGEIKVHSNNRDSELPLCQGGTSQVRTAKILYISKHSRSIECKIYNAIAGTPSLICDIPLIGFPLRYAPFPLIPVKSYMSKIKPFLLHSISHLKHPSPQSKEKKKEFNPSKAN